MCPHIGSYDSGRGPFDLDPLVGGTSFGDIFLGLSFRCVTDEENAREERPQGKPTSTYLVPVRAGSSLTPQIVLATNAACNIYSNGIYWYHTDHHEQQPFFCCF